MNNKNVQLMLLGLVVIAIPLTVLAAKLAFDLQTSADTGDIPHEIIVSNLTDSSSTICWYTSKIMGGLINYGIAQNDLVSVARDMRDTQSSLGEYNTHCVKIKNLTSETKYFYSITSGSRKFDNDGINKFSFTTLPSSNDLATPSSLIGSITPDISEGIVYAHASDGKRISTSISLPVNRASYALSKSNFRDKQTGGIFDLTNSAIFISFTDSQGRRGNIQVPGSTSKADPITITSNGKEYNPKLILQVTPTPEVTIAQATPTPVPTIAPTPIIQQLGVPNTTDLITSTVTYNNTISNDPRTPNTIFISNISPTTFCVNWLTKQATTGKLLYKIGTSPDSIAVDGRDTINTQIKRYTHTVCFSESTFKGGDKVGFFILSDNTKYGINLNSTESSRFIFAMPSVPQSPPSPGSVEGVINKTYNPISVNPRDVLIYARYAGNTTSSWVSTYTDTSGEKWSLRRASILTQELDGYYNTDISTYQVEIRGEFNSKSTGTTTATDTRVLNTQLDPGASITNIGQNEHIQANSQLIGTNTPNKNITVNVGAIPYSTSTDSSGQWQITLNQLTSGNIQVSETDSKGGSMIMTVKIINDKSNPLPATAINDFKPIIAGIVLIVIGLILQVSIKRNKYDT